MVEKYMLLTKGNYWYHAEFHRNVFSKNEWKIKIKDTYYYVVGVIGHSRKMENVTGEDFKGRKLRYSKDNNVNSEHLFESPEIIEVYKRIA